VVLVSARVVAWEHALGRRASASIGRKAGYDLDYMIGRMREQEAASTRPHGRNLPLRTHPLRERPHVSGTRSETRAAPHDEVLVRQLVAGHGAYEDHGTSGRERFADR
jgi:hypothetical protein